MNCKNFNRFQIFHAFILKLWDKNPLPYSEFPPWKKVLSHPFRKIRRAFSPPKEGGVNRQFKQCRAFLVYFLPEKRTKTQNFSNNWNLPLVDILGATICHVRCSNHNVDQETPLFDGWTFTGFIPRLPQIV